MPGGRDVWEICVSPQFWCELKTALKYSPNKNLNLPSFHSILLFLLCLFYGKTPPYV